MLKSEQRQSVSLGKPKGLICAAPTRRTAARPKAKPSSPHQVSGVLLDYLAEKLGRADLCYRETPTEMRDGWETFIYRFQLQGDGLPAAFFGAPLIARIYSSVHGLPRARHEFVVEKGLRRLKYAAPDSLLLEEDCRYFGGPFLIQALAPGETLFRSLLRRPWAIWTAPRKMAAIHARLHQLPSNEFPTAAGSFLGRSLEGFAHTIDACGLPGLLPGVDWLIRHGPPEPANPSILHLDFHPINIIRRDDGSLSVLDWTEADVGDPHADVAMTLLLMQCVRLHEFSLRDRVALRMGRPWMLRWYRLAYRRLMPVDDARLAYYRAWAALRRICQYERWLHDGPAVDGCKPAALQHVNVHYLGQLAAYFRKWSGVPVSV